MYLHTSDPQIGKKTLLHRDLKPSNLLVSSLWERAEVNILISDFGLSRHVTAKEKSYSMGVGTCIYMAPEIISSSKYSKKVDVYSFGVILWEMIVRLEPFEEIETPFMVEKAVVGGKRPKIPSNIPSRIKEVITTCWSQDASLRPEFANLWDIFQIQEVKQQCLSITAIKPKPGTKL